MDFNYLVNIHKRVFNINEDDFRDNLGDDVKEIIASSLNKINKEYQNLNELVSDLLQFGGYVYLFQPFIDGNKRTALSIYKEILDSRNINLDWNKILNNFRYVDLIPIFDSPFDTVSQRSINNMINIINTCKKDIKKDNYSNISRKKKKIIQIIKRPNF